MLICWRGNIDVVKLLVANHADITIKTLDNITAIDIAKEEGHEDIISYLENNSNIPSIHLTDDELKHFKESKKTSFI